MAPGLGAATSRPIQCSQPTRQPTRQRTDSAAMLYPAYTASASPAPRGSESPNRAAVGAVSHLLQRQPRSRVAAHHRAWRRRSSRRFQSLRRAEVQFDNRRRALPDPVASGGHAQRTSAATSATPGFDGPSVNLACRCRGIPSSRERRARTPDRPPSLSLSLHLRPPKGHPPDRSLSRNQRPPAASLAAHPDVPRPPTGRSRTEYTAKTLAFPVPSPYIGSDSP